MPPKPRYDIHPTVAVMADWIASLEAKTGRSLDAWMKFVRKQGFKDEKAAIAALRKEANVGAHAARWLAQRALTKDLSIMDDDPDRYLALAPRYVAEQYEGKKAALSPIFDSLVKLGRAVAKDVKVCPCKTVVPFYREHVFAQIKPTTNSRVDLGLCLIPLLKAKKPIPARIIDTGGFAKKDRITHRIPIDNVDQIDEFVERWLTKAYELDA